MADAQAIVEIVGKQSVSGPAGVAAGALHAVEAAAGKAGSVLGSLASTALNAGAALGAIGAAGVVAGFTAATGKAAEFEKQLSAVGAVSGASAEQMKQLSGLALQLGADTSFSASESAKGIGELVKAGVSIADVMGGAAKASLDLAAAGGVDVATAAEIASNAMNVFNIKGKDMAHVADEIAGAANASAIDVNDYKFSLAAAGSVAATVGVSFDDLSTAIAVMGQAGIKGSDAGTSLKTLLLNLTPSTKSAKEEMQKLGIITKDGANQFFDAHGKAKSMADIAGVLQKATKGLTEQQRLQALQTLFGTDAIRAAAIMSKAGAAGFNEMAESIGKVSASDVANTRLDNLAGSIEKFTGSAETAAITVGQHLMPPLRRMVDIVTDLINKSLPGLDRFGTDLGTTFDTLTTRVASAGPALLEMASTLRVRVGNAIDWLVTTGWPMFTDAVATAARWITGTAIPAIQSLAAWLGPKLTDAFSWVVQTGWPTFLSGATAALGWIQGTGLPTLAALSDWLGPKLSAALTWLTQAGWPALVSAATTVSDWAIGTAVPALSNLVDWLGPKVSVAVQWLTNTGWPALVTTATAVSDWVMQTAVPALASLVDWLGPKVSTAVQWLMNTGWPSLVSTATAVSDWVMGTALPALASLWDWLSPKLGAALSWLSATGWPALVSAAQAVSGWINDTALPALSALWDWLSPKLSAALAWLTDTGWPALKSAAVAVWDWISGTAIPVLQDWWSWLSEKLSPVVEWFTSTAWPAFKAAAATAWDWIATTAIPTLQEWWSWLEEKIQPAVQWFIDTGWPNLVTAGQKVKELWDGLVQGATDFWTKIQDKGVITDLGQAFDSLWNAGKILVETFWPQMIGGEDGTGGAKGASSALDAFVYIAKTGSTFIKDVALGIEMVAKALKWVKDEADQMPDWVKNALLNGASAMPATRAIAGMFIGGGGEKQPQSGRSGSGGGNPYKAGSREAQAYNAAVKSGHPNPTEFVEQMRWESGGFAEDVISGKRDSGAGARGIAQIMPDVAKSAGVDPLDVDAALEYAAKRMAAAYSTYGNSDDALASYNMGAGNLQKYGAHGLSETDKYISIIHEKTDDAIAAAGNTKSNMSSNTGSQRLDTSSFAVGNQWELGLPRDQAEAACGPAAVAIFEQMMGRTPNSEEVMAIASKNGWTADRGMGGPQAFMNTLSDLAIEASADYSPTQQEAASAVSSGHGVAFSTAGGAGHRLNEGHYFVAQGYNAQTGEFDFGETAGTDPNTGATGAVKGSSRYLTYDQVVELAGPVQALVTLMGGAAPVVDTASASLEGMGTAATVTAKAADDTRVKFNLLATDSQVDISQAADGMVTQITDAAGNVTSTVTDLNGNVVRQFASMADGTLIATGNMGTDLIESLDTTSGLMNARMTDAAGNVVETITNMKGEILLQTATMASGAGANISAVGTAAATAKGPLDALAQTFNNPQTGAAQAADAAAEAARQYAKALNDVAAAADNVNGDGNGDSSDGSNSDHQFTPDPTLFGGGKASGGPISAGVTYRVNEDGTEYFRSSTSGYITPNGQTSQSVTADADRIGAAIAKYIAPMIAQTRPVIIQGTSEEIVREVTAILREQSDAYASLRGLG